MKYSFVLLLVIFSICSCAFPKIYKPNNTYNNITLMPYWDDNGKKGYINSETFEIIIPAEYEYTGIFVGDFALVSKYKDSFKQKCLIIDKNNRKIMI